MKQFLMQKIYQQSETKLQYFFSICRKRKTKPNVFVNIYRHMTVHPALSALPGIAKYKRSKNGRGGEKKRRGIREYNMLSY